MITVKTGNFEDELLNSSEGGPPTEGLFSSHTTHPQIPTAPSLLSNIASSSSSDVTTVRSRQKEPGAIEVLEQVGRGLEDVDTIEKLQKSE